MITHLCAQFVICLHYISKLMIADVNWHDVFSYSNCGSRFISEPTRDGHIRFVEFVDTVDNASDCLDDFDLKWNEKFGPDSITVMSSNEFDHFMKEVIEFDGE